MCEPLVAQACNNLFQFIGFSSLDISIQASMCESAVTFLFFNNAQALFGKSNPPACGFMFEPLALSHVLSYLSQFPSLGVLSSHIKGRVPGWLSKCRIPPSFEQCKVSLLSPLIW